MLVVSPTPTATVTASSEFSLSKKEIELLIPDRALYRPADAAKLCSISEDSVTRALALRPGLFPPKVWARRHEWTRKQLIDVVWALTALSCRASRGLEKNVREKCG